MNSSVKNNQPYQQENNQGEYELEYEPEYISPYENTNNKNNEYQQQQPGYVYDPRYGWIYIYGNQGVDDEDQNNQYDYIYDNRIEYSNDYGNNNMVLANTNNINSLAVGKVGTIKSNKQEKNDKTKKQKIDKKTDQLERTSSNIPTVSNKIDVNNKTSNNKNIANKNVGSMGSMGSNVVNSRALGSKEYNIPLDSNWFETENGVSLESYLKKLFSLVRDNLACNVEANTTRGILVPHAGIRYSGLCAASAYYELTNRTKKIKHIIMLCTNHQAFDISRGVNIIGCTYSNIQSFRNSTSNSGENGLQIDVKTMSKLKPYINIDDTMFEKEHSFFNQLPFIEMIARDA